MASLQRNFAKVDVFQELQNLEHRATQLDRGKAERNRQDQELRSLKRKLEKLKLKRDSLKKQLKSGPKQIIKDALKTGGAISEDVKSSLETLLQDTELKREQELLSIYRLTGSSVDIENNILRWRFDTAYKGEFYEPYYVEFNVDDKKPVKTICHNLPSFIPMDELTERHLYHDTSGLVTAVHQYLVPFVMRREEVLMMERRFVDNIDGEINVSGSYDFISFTLNDVKYFDEPIDVRLVYDNLKDIAPARISITPTDGTEVTTAGRQLIGQYSDLFSQRPISEAVEAIITGEINTSGSSIKE